MAGSNSGVSNRGLRLCFRVAAVLGLLAVFNGFLAFIAGAGFRSLAQRHVALSAEGGTTLEKKPKAQNEYRLNVGRAIDVLRRDMVGLFGREQHVPDFSIYSPDIEVIDAHLPSFQLRGLATYQQVLSTMQWSIKTTCDRTKMEITSLTPPVNDQMYVRWRLHLWFKDVRSLLPPAFGGSPMMNMQGPLIVEGYSRYQFDPWSAEIVKHTIEITNPPMHLSDLVGQYARTPSWAMPVSTGLGVPSLTRAWPMHEASALTGATTARARSSTSRAATARSSGWLPGLPQGWVIAKNHFLHLYET